MNKFSITLMPFFLATILTVSVVAQNHPPTVHRDRHICPGEGCDYSGNATVKTSSRVFASIGMAKHEFILRPGEIVKIQDSEVHTRAGRYVVKRPFEKYKPGDVIWVYTYRGEGYFKTWYKGKWAKQDLGFSPWGGTSGNRCQNDDKHCFGELDRELDMRWWVKVRTKSRRTGWVLVKDWNLEWPEGN